MHKATKTLHSQKKKRMPLRLSSAFVHSTAGWKREATERKSKDGACVISILQIEELRPGEEVNYYFPRIDKGRKL